MVGRSFVLLVALTGVAAADSAHLQEARDALTHVRYDEAEKLLVAALQDGTNSPAAVVEIYRLSASTAVVLDRKDLGEQYYRRWLALDPTASLPTDLAPKIRAPFVKAQAYMAAHGRLVAKVARTASIQIVVETDPLGMAVAASVDGGAPVKLDADHRATFQTGTRAAVLDEYGNRLVDLDIPAATITTPPTPPIGIDKPPTTHRVSPLRRGRTWAAASGVTLGVGLVFGYLASSANDDVTSIGANSDLHTFAEFDDARGRRDRWALIANGSFITGGALAVVSALLFTGVF